MFLGLIDELTVLVANSSFGAAGYNHSQATQSLARNRGRFGVGLTSPSQ